MYKNEKSKEKYFFGRTTRSGLAPLVKGKDGTYEMK
jgi:hypothetical protein